MYRSLYLRNDKDDSIQGIDLLRFTTDMELMLNATENEANKAFCLGRCWKTGIIPIGQCQDGGIQVQISIYLKYSKISLPYYSKI